MRSLLMQLPKPTAIVFDWDNTLVNTWPIIYQAMVETFVQMGVVPWTLEETKQKVGKSLRDHFPALFGDKWEVAGKIYGDTYRANNLANMEGLPQAAQMLELLATTKLYRAVVSNKQGPTLRQEAAHIGWDKYFNKLVGALDAPRDKPYPDPLYLALEGSGIEAGPHVWFIGDTMTDVDCALNSGCTPIFYGDGTVEERAKDKVFYINDHGHLTELLKNHA